MKNLAGLLHMKAEGSGVASSSKSQKQHEKKNKKKGAVSVVSTPTQEEVDLADRLANELILEEENARKKTRGGMTGKGKGGHPENKKKKK